jgi:hypothetical protein
MNIEISFIFCFKEAANKVTRDDKKTQADLAVVISLSLAIGHNPAKITAGHDGPTASIARGHIDPQLRQQWPTTAKITAGHDGLQLRRLEGMLTHS